MSPSPPRTTALIGAGRLARSLAPSLLRAGYRVVAVTAHSAASARRLARTLPRSTATLRLERAVAHARLVLVAVSDREIAPVARRLAAVAAIDWSRRTVLHHAGALGTEVLAPLARRGAAVGVMHPLQALGTPRVGSAVLPGSAARIEGDARGRIEASRLAKKLGLRVLPLGPRPSASDRAAYHAAASLASNDVVALLALAADLLESLGLDREDALDALVPLARGTLEHLRSGGFEAGLTGPVARGDVETVAKQLRRLRRRSRDGAEIHRLLSMRLLKLAAEGDGLSAADRREMSRLLRRPPS